MITPPSASRTASTSSIAAERSTVRSSAIAHLEPDVPDTQSPASSWPVATPGSDSARPGRRVYHRPHPSRHAGGIALSVGVQARK